MKKLAVALLASSGLWLAQLAPVSAAGNSPDIVTPVAPATCTQLTGTSGPCYIVMSVMSVRTASRVSPNGSDPCGSLHTTWKFNSLFYTYATVYMNAGWCWDGSNASQNWGPQCYVQTGVGEGSDQNSCSWTSGNNQWQLSDSSNFDLWRWVTPWYKHYGWIHQFMRGNGTWNVTMCFDNNC